MDEEERKDAIDRAVRNTLTSGTLRGHRALEALHGERVVPVSENHRFGIGVDYADAEDHTATHIVYRTGPAYGGTVTGRFSAASPNPGSSPNAADYQAVRSGDTIQTVRSLGVTSREAAQALGAFSTAMQSAGRAARDTQEVTATLSDNTATMQAALQAEAEQLFADRPGGIQEVLREFVREAAADAVRRILDGSGLLGHLGPVTPEPTAATEEPTPKGPDMSVPQRRPRRYLKP